MLIKFELLDKLSSLIVITCPDYTNLYDVAYHLLCLVACQIEHSHQRLSKHKHQSL